MNEQEREKIDIEKRDWRGAATLALAALACVWTRTASAIDGELPPIITDFAIDPHDRDCAQDVVLSITSNFWCDPQGRRHFFFDQSMGASTRSPRGYTHMDGRAGVWEMVSDNPDDPKPKWSAPRRIGGGHVVDVRN